MPALWAELKLAEALTIVTMIGGAFGWYTTVRLNRAAARSQHTFDVLLTMALDKSYQGHLAAARPHFVKPGDNGLPDLNDAANADLCNSIVFLLNYYEFLAGAVRYGVLSEDLVRDDQGYIIRQLFTHARKYIVGLREQRKRPALFGQIEWLYDRWNGPGTTGLRRFQEWLLTRPVYGR